MIIPMGSGRENQCLRGTKKAGQVLWSVLRMTAWAFPTATMRTTDVWGQWCGPVLQLHREVHKGEEAQEDVEIWWGEEHEGSRAGVRIGWDKVRGTQEEDDGVAVTFQMTDTGRPGEEAPLVPMGHRCGESGRQISLTVHRLLADRLW